MNVDGSFVGSANMERAGIGFNTSMSPGHPGWKGDARGVRLISAKSTIYIYIYIYMYVYINIYVYDSNMNQAQRVQLWTLQRIDAIFRFAPRRRAHPQRPGPQVPVAAGAGYGVKVWRRWTCEVGCWKLQV